MLPRRRRTARRPPAGLLPALVALTVPVALAACSATAPNGPGGAPADARSGVTGVVVRWPVCPVEGAPESRDCHGEPTEATVRVRERSSDREVAAVRTGPDGRFRVPLRAGVYEVRAQAPGTGHCKPVGVTVRPGAYTEITVRCDTGLR
ncbi:carboxypeptidase regulatory-like domain-containing protein [Streptomyces collinus]|uniref:carboxypeptidase regulatory-like domain-containing protein n=1 Tax=Streptomyces collinus TaxID=42684 RepID=UPI0029438233|nr:carboxypeptidase regulatory-like domain-containing protein [Streptomyces collinus]